VVLEGVAGDEKTLLEALTTRAGGESASLLK
jgi:hypothetical protein